MAIKLQNRVFLTIKLSKPFIFDHLTVLKGDFADVDDTWQWGPHISYFSSLLLPLSLSFLSPICQHCEHAGGGGAMAAAHRGRLQQSPKPLHPYPELGTFSLLSSTILFFFLWSPLIELKLHLLCDQITLIPSMYFKSLPPKAHSPPKFPSQPLLHEL